MIGDYSSGRIMTTDGMKKGQTILPCVAVESDQPQNGAESEP